MSEDNLRFVGALRESNIVEYIGHDSQDDVVQLTFRVLLPNKWQKLLVSLLLTGHEGEGYDLEPRKSYFVDENRRPKFHWVLLVWGELNEAYDDLRPLLSMRYDPKPKHPSGKDPRMMPLPQRLRAVREEEIDGSSRIRTIAPIPHSRGMRYGTEEETIGPDTPDRKFKATVRSRGERGHNPQRGGGDSL